MKYCKTHLKVLAVVFFCLAMMAIAGDPVQADAANTVVISSADYAH